MAQRRAARTQVDTTTHVDAIRALLVDTAAAAAEHERPDLAERVAAAQQRLERPGAVICVVGEFKQGKSSLVNGLLARAVCPVDDDLATSAITVLRHAPELSVTVHRREDGRAISAAITLEELPAYVTEHGGAELQQGVERVEIGLPDPLLERPVVLVDTPGVGGLGAGHAAAVLAYLRYVDAIIFVSDASAELSRPELDLLTRVADGGPSVLVCLTKTDLYPAWRHIRDLDTGHLERVGLAAPIVATSAHLRDAARTRGDDDLDAWSGFPALLGALEEGVLTDVTRTAGARSLADARDALTVLATARHAELAMLADPEAAAAAATEIQRVADRLEHLGGRGARWTTVLSDGITDLEADARHGLEARLREAQRTFDAATDAASSAAEWTELIRQAQTDVATAVADAFATIEHGGEELRDRIAALIAEEGIDLPTIDGVTAAPDVASLWTQDAATGAERRGGRLGAGGMVALQGAATGLDVFAIVERLIPAAGAAMMLANPISLGLGVVFGGKQLLEHRKERVDEQRNEAHEAVATFLDDVRFEVGAQLDRAVRTIHRLLRDEFTELLAQLDRSYRDALARARATADLAGKGRAKRLKALKAQIEQLDALTQRAAELAASP